MPRAWTREHASRRHDISAIFGETLSFGQANGPDIRLRVTGDEFYATYETLDGYTAVSDTVMYAGQTQYEGELWPHNSTIELRYGAISTNLHLWFCSISSGYSSLTSRSP